MRNLRSEEEIISDWYGDIERPTVSICCISYNHETYIEDALEGFLIQKTNFPFEILIHDDASTDKTSEIIKRYEASYPKLIKPIYQRENQFSKGVKVNFIFNFPRVKGEYIALCEGDDYWTDCEKLQIQYDFCEKNKLISLVVHSCVVDNLSTKKSYILAKHNRSFHFNLRDILINRNQWAATSSYFFKKEVIDVLPKWLHEAPFGDFFIETYSQKIGNGFYMENTMSTYRLMHQQSWTFNQKKSLRKNLIIKEKMLECLELMESDFKNSIHDISIRKKIIYKDILRLLFDLKDEDKLSYYLLMRKKYFVVQITPSFLLKYVLHLEYVFFKAKFFLLLKLSAF